MTIKWFKGVSNLDELKQLYKKLAKTWHPDMNKQQDTTKIFVEIKEEFDKLFDKLRHTSTFNSSNNRQQSTSSDNNRQQSTENAEKFREIIDILLKYDEFNVELVGSWIWVSGNTYNNRQILKDLGFQWSKSNKKWYWTETPIVKKRQKATSWEYKVSTFGCEKLSNNRKQHAKIDK
jgi:hypothetical protein